ncbi:hypothetical protein DPMN_089013 [Dreissena polymorpha]|uniref:Uncharacterized protein n=1 Tax=Dreissena polymorpha TaxID=45954 RepID=A0A9D4KVK9_DREPO|nr:hypothetical protein DPMN_089013 [Dreissena polymorpha]
MWELIYDGGADRRFYILGGLAPYSEHTVKMEACNAVGCVNSTETRGRSKQDCKSLLN